MVVEQIGVVNDRFLHLLREGLLAVDAPQEALKRRGQLVVAQRTLPSDDDLSGFTCHGCLACGFVPFDMLSSRGVICAPA